MEMHRFMSFGADICTLVAHCSVAPNAPVCAKPDMVAAILIVRHRIATKRRTTRV